MRDSGRDRERALEDRVHKLESQMREVLKNHREALENNDELRGQLRLQQDQQHINPTVSSQLQSLQEGVFSLCKHFRLDCTRGKALFSAETPLNIRDVNALRSNTRRREPSPDPKRSRRSSPDERRVARALYNNRRPSPSRYIVSRFTGESRTDRGRGRDRDRDRAGERGRDREQGAERVKDRDERDKAGEQQKEREAGMWRNDRKAAEKAKREESDSEGSDEWSGSGSSDTSASPDARPITRPRPSHPTLPPRMENPTPPPPALTPGLPDTDLPPPQTPPLGEGGSTTRAGVKEGALLAEEESTARESVETGLLQAFGQLLAGVASQKRALMAQAQVQVGGPLFDQLVGQESCARERVEAEMEQGVKDLSAREKVEGVSRSESSGRSKIGMDCIRERAAFVEQLESSSRAVLQQSGLQAVVVNGLQALRQLVKHLMETEKSERRAGNWKVARALGEKRAEAMTQFNRCLQEAVLVEYIDVEDTEYSPYEFKKASSCTTK